MSITTINACNFHQQASPERAREAIEEELLFVAEKIDTWTRIAFKQGIDIGEEINHLNMLKQDHVFEEGGKLGELEEKKLIACQIVRKVTQNFGYDVDPQMIGQLKDGLGVFTMNVCVPWCQTAKSEGVDISEELNLISQEVINDMEVLSNGKDHHKEVVYRKHRRIREILTNQIVLKIYRNRIDSAAEFFKSKDYFDEERQIIIEGIRFEAQQLLPASLESKSLIERVEILFQTYLDNLNLYDTNPTEYHHLADIEVFHRSIDQWASTYLEALPEDSPYRERIEEARILAHQVVQKETYSEDLLERVNLIFHILEEQIECT